MRKQSDVDGGPREAGVRIKEAAVMLAVSTRSVYRLIKRGELPEPRKILGCSVLPLSAVQRLLRGN
jgi:excisionase family DNA binding protein